MRSQAATTPPKVAPMTLEALEARDTPATFTFAGYSFEDTAAPDKASFLAANTTFEGAVVSDVPTSAVFATVAFPDAPAPGFDPNLTLGTTFFGGSGSRPLNLPSGNDGTTKRSGVLLEYTGQRAIQNGVGTELLSFESGGKTALSANPQAYMVQAYVVDTASWTRWYYTPATKFGFYSGSTNAGAYATEYDFSDLGVPAGAIVSQVRLVNMTAQDRMDSATGVGFVRPEDAGATSAFFPTPGSQSTRVTFDGTGYDPDPLFVTSLATPVSTNVSANVTVTQSVAPAAPLTAGTKATFTVTVSNGGAAQAAGVTFTGSLPAALTGVTFTAVASPGAAGATASGSGVPSDVLTLPSMSNVVYTVTGTIDPAATSKLSVAFAAGLPNPPVVDVNPADNNSAADYALQTVGNAVVTISSPTLTAGSKATYTLTASNPGPSTLTGVGLTSTLPASLNGVTFTSTAAGGATGNSGGTGPVANTLTLPPGSTVTYTVTGSLDPAASGKQTATISAGVPAPQTNTDPAKSTASASATVVQSADLGVTTVGVPATPSAGSTVTYTVTVTNNGPSLATGAKLADSFSAAYSSVTFTSKASGGATDNTAAGTGDLAETLTLPPGASVVYTVSAKLSPQVTGPVTDTATVSAPAGVTDPNPANDTATATVTVLPIVVPSADLGVTIVGVPATPIVAGTVTYTVTVTNNGPSLAAGAKFVDTFSSAYSSVTFTSQSSGGASGNTAAGTGDLAETLTLPPGASVVYTVSAKLSPQVTGLVTDTATVSAPAGVTDPNPANDTATANVTVLAQANVSIGVSPNAIVGVIGQPTTFTVIVTNSGPSGAAGITIAGVLPKGLSNVSFTSTQGGGASGNSGAGTGTPTDVLDLPAGGRVVYTVTGTPTPGTVGTDAVRFQLTAPDGVPISSTSSLSVSAAIVTGAAPKVIYAVGTGVGVPGDVFVFNADGTERFRFRPYENSFTGGVRVAVGDANNDGFPDVVVSPAEGGGPRLVVVDGFTGKYLYDAFVYEPGMRNGVFVALGDTNGSGRNQIVTGPGLGGAPRVRVFDIPSQVVLRDFFAYGPELRGGVRVAVDSLGNQLVTAPGEGGSPQVRVFGPAAAPVAQFFAGDPASRQGISIAVGDLDGSRRSSLVVGSGAGGVPVVSTYNLQTGQATGQFQAYESSFTGGVRVATYVDTNGATPETRVLTGAGFGGGPRVQDFRPNGTGLRTNQFVIPTDFRGGIYVG